MTKKKLILKWFFGVIAVYVAVMLYATSGPVIRIETTEPTQDYVVRCTWASTFLVIHGGAQIIDTRIGVINSGENYSCGISLMAAILNGRGGASILHPLYTRMQGVDEDGVSVIRPTSYLDILDEQKAKFEAGEWDRHKWPETRYADSIKGICWFPYQYFDYYRQDRRITLEHFESLYYEPILQCYKRVVPILRKYDKSYKNMKEAEEYVKGFWEPQKWEKFND